MSQEEPNVAKKDKITEETPIEETVEETVEETAETVEVNPWEEKYKAEHDAHLRLAAEYDNFRKRTAKEKEALYGTAKADTIKPFLDVYDNLLRGAAQFAEDDPNRQGMDLICKQFVDVLAKLGVTEIDALGKPFDPERHNAVMHVEDENIEESTVVEVFQKGFIMGDQVLRFPMVKVAN
jgi:molecular chaperone GrpE